jgi:hypothetical protein
MHALGTIAGRVTLFAMDSTAMSEFLLQKWKNLMKRSFELLTDGNAIDESTLTSLAAGQG